MKTILTTLIALILIAPFTANAQANGRIKVTVYDEKLAPFPGAIVKIIAGGPTMGGATDMDGVFTFAGLNPGTYDVECRVTGYKRYVKTGIQVDAGQTAYAEYNMTIANDTTTTVIIKAVKSPVDPKFSTIQNINATQIKTMAADRGNIVGMVSGTNSQVSEGKGGQLVMRGSREGASAVYVDGEKLYGTMGVPALSMNQVSVLSGGIPAEFGDLSGGAIIITTHSYYTGMSQRDNMYEAAQEKEAEEKKAADAASGKRVENSDQIIEKQDSAKTEMQPAPVEPKKEEPNKEEPKKEEPKKEEAKKEDAKKEEQKADVPQIQPVQPK